MWLYVPRSSRSARASEVSISASDSPWEGDAVLWATSSGKPSQQPSSWRGWKTRRWIRRLSGTISNPSRATSIAERWLASLADFPVSPTPPRDGSRATTTNARSGRSFSATSRRSPRRGSFSRTSPTSSDTSNPSGQDFASWASSVRRPASSPRTSVARRISADVSLSLPSTPSASTVGTNHGGAAGRVGGARPLVRSLPTPTAGDARTSGAAGYSTVSGRHSGTTLTDFATGAASEGRAGRLNPRFSEWMMGLPIGWTSFARSATPSFRRWQRSHSRRWPEEC